MARSELTFDELNRLDFEGRRSEDYEEYFSGMGLTDEQMRQRIELAESFEKELIPVFAYLNIMRIYGMLDEDDASKKFSDAFLLAVATVVAIDSEFQELADDYGKVVGKATAEHPDDPWYFSRDRIIFDSENESETVWSKIDYDDAVMQGKTHKQWISMRDKRVRETHSKVDAVTKRIYEPFLVGESLMMYPKDTSMGADASEIVNCRCIAQYF